MKSTTTRTWMVVGVCLVLLATLVMGWFAGRVLPGDPNSLPQDTETNKYPNKYNSVVRSVQDVDVVQGDSLLIEGLTQGHKYTQPELSKFDEIKNSPYFSFDYGALTLAVGETKVVSGKAVKEWYPDSSIPDTSIDPRFRGSDLPGKAFLVTVMATNMSQTETLHVPSLTLWSADFNQVADVMGAGAYPSIILTSLLYPRNSPDDVADSAELGAPYEFNNDEWLNLAPGETREIVFPYYVYRNSFADGAAFDNVDLTKFCVEANDYDPGIRYRFWLG